LSSLSSRFAVTLISSVFAFTTAQAATHPQINVSPKTRIVDKVDNGKVVAVPRSHSLRVDGLADQGRVPANTQLGKIMLVLQSSPEQEYALNTLMDAQQDKGSPNYHQWMTPDTFGQYFGVASTDIATVTAWLQDSGFSVDHIMSGSRVIVFSGTAGQVESAFHTEMHQYLVNGQMRISNSTDISIPSALSPVVLGVAKLNNFPLTSNVTPMQHVAMGPHGWLPPAVSGTLQPDVTWPTSQVHYIGGADFPILFDSKPLLAAGINGAGIKIGILGQTDILVGDEQTYRSIFGLPTQTVNFITVGNDPGTIADDIESDLDVEVSGAFAPGATIDFYLSGNDYFSGGIDASGMYVIENNSDDIISLSYGEAEQDLGVYNAFFNTLWEQASSQGISVFVSSGDSGPDVHDDGATSGSTYSVSGLSGTPYNVAVGGTMFNEGTATGATSYWGPTNGPPYATALGYIPEIPWNESYDDPYGATAGYGSSIVAESSGISIEYGTPSWQTGPGVPTVDPVPTKGTVKGFLVPGPHRYQPDVALAAAGAHDGTLICSEGSCEVDSNGNLLNAGVVGGTSIAAPSFAGVQALIDQKNGGRQGLPNYYYYKLAAISALQSTTNCNAATLPSSAGAGCVFHDIQTGNNFIPTVRSNAVSTGNYIGWTAGPGFDMAIGLGSPDIANLANDWSQASFAATTTALTLTPTSTSSGATENFTLKVTPVSGSGIPTGDVSIIATSATEGGVGYTTLASGAASGTFANLLTPSIISATLTGLSALPAGTYSVHAHYAGDTTYGGSNSPSINVIITSTSTSIVNTPYLLATSGALTNQSTFQYGQNVYIDTQVCTPSGLAVHGCAAGIPTGTITYTLNTSSATFPTLVAPLDSFDDTYLDAGIGLAAYDIKPNYPSVAAPQVLAPGVYTVNTKYSGDTTFNASTGTPFTITVTQASQALTLTTGTATIPSAGTAIFNASITTLDPTSSGAPATGTVTFTDTTTSTVLGTGTLTNGAVVFSTTKITTTGAHVINATYSGDTNYAAATSGNVTVTVGGTASTTTLATTVGGVAATTSQVGQTVALVATVPTTATGTVYFYDGAVLLGTGTVSATTHTATRNQATFTAGTHTLTATYGGNTTLDSSTSAAATYIVTKNTPTLQLTNQTQNAAGQGVGMNATLTPTPSNAANINPAPTGGVNFLDGTTVLGSAAPVYLSNFGVFVAAYTTAALKPGVHTLSTVYPGDANYGTATSNSQTINIGLTTTALKVSATNVGTGTPFTLTATITPIVASTNLPGGTVTYTDTTTNTVLGTSAVLAGVSTLTTSVSTLGAHSITAVYSGDTNFYTSTASSSVSLTSVTPGFSISVNPTSLTVTRGTNGVIALSATVYGNYSGYGLTTIAGLPANSSYIITTSPYVFSGVDGTQTYNVYITTLAPQAKVKPASFLWLPAILLAGLLAFRRKQLNARGRQLVVFAILMFGMLAVSGCGSSGGFPGTTTGNSTATITMVGTGTNAASPSVTATTTFSLTVQ